MTNEQMNRIVADYSRHAGETVTAELINSTLYIYCSELGSLRLYRIGHAMVDANQGYSTNLGTHYFSFTVRFN